MHTSAGCNVGHRHQSAGVQIALCAQWLLFSRFFAFSQMFVASNSFTEGILVRSTDFPEMLRSASREPNVNTNTHAVFHQLPLPKHPKHPEFKPARKARFAPGVLQIIAAFPIRAALTLTKADKQDDCDRRLP